METETIPGTDIPLTVLRYGTPGGRKAYLQAGLHADEFPGMLVLRALGRLLDRAAERGAIRGEIVLVPQANPIGLRQHDSGFLLGRLDAATGENFNRGYPDLSVVGEGLTPGPDPAANVVAIRAAMAAVLAAERPGTPLAWLRHRLLTLAHDADLVLDLHADNQAEPHMYVGPALWPASADIAAAIDARAVLLAEVSGGHPFDEACSGPWWALAARFPDAAIPPACLAATLEVGSNDDVDPARAADQAAALLRVLEGRGFVDGPGGQPRLACEATPLTAMAQVRAPVTGLIAYRARLGDTVRAGEVVATIIDPTGAETEVTAETGGRLFARHSQPYAWPGKVIGKIAGAEPLASRSGNLLTD
ncbi:succinylglutamate desuccinylase/aspartoacylase family protein [Paenirhodobacter populi]|uniref:succinylglutamate desuccinylase/aspartoacylase family protein n=1 Tax=Paenirhodobacter populi TaxID=2306993 RepID=UPI000FE3D214|nr:succinylglutamate desuccinylase/aspartoacylase family protein [Sinirhodobacter populi]RWR09085.1 succinylglutamate desuccinylase/aspartoacylase family protein [Sinirhodobacter populi]